MRRTPRNMRGELLRYYRRLFRHFGPQHWWPARTRFEVILGALLTQNTSWTNVERALANLRRRGLLAPKKLAQVPPSRLAHLLQPAGYFRQKARYVAHFVRHLNGSNGGSVARLLRGPTEKLRAELLALPGVGPETADSILLYAAGRPVFVIDAYTRRVLARHGLAQEQASYDELQTFFHDNLPRDARLFNEFHAQLVAVGKNFCHKRRPDCAACPLGPELGGDHRKSLQVVAKAGQGFSPDIFSPGNLGAFRSQAEVPRSLREAPEGGLRAGIAVNSRQRRRTPSQASVEPAHARA